MKKTYNILICCLLSFAFIGCDRATKNLAKEHLQNKEPQTYFHDTVRLVYVENTGAFLSLGAGWSQGVSFWVLNVLPLLFLSGLFIYIIKEFNNLSFMKMLPLLLILSGGIGNIMDRLMFNMHVSDFINIGINNLRTGVFNFADIYITAGVLLALIMQFKKTRRQTIYNK